MLKAIDDLLLFKNFVLNNRICAVLRASSVASSKECACNAGDAGSVPGFPEGGHSNPPSPVFLPEETHEQRDVAGYSS